MTDIDPTFESLLEFLRDARGFDWSGYRRPSLMRRVEKRMQAVGAADYDAYRAYLAKHPDEFMELFNTILNAVGCKKADGSPVDDFGDASLAKGELDVLKKA